MIRLLSALAVIVCAYATSPTRGHPTWSQHCDPCGDSGRPGVTILCCDALTRGAQ
jgi:hypothetical protein